jgi:hypothetical protein
VVALRVHAVSRTTSVLVIWEVTDPDVHLSHDVRVSKVPDDKDREMILKTLVSWTVNHLMQLLVRENFTEFGRCENFNLQASEFSLKF